MLSINNQRDHQKWDKPFRQKSRFSYDPLFAEVNPEFWFSPLWQGLWVWIWRRVDSRLLLTAAGVLRLSSSSWCELLQPVMNVILIYNYLHSLLKINIHTGKQRLFTKSSLVNNYDTTILFIVTHKHLQRQISTLNSEFPVLSQSVLLDLWDPCCKPNPTTRLVY